MASESHSSANGSLHGNAGSAVMHGLIAAPYTPFDAQGDLKLDVIQQYAESLVRDGVTGAFVCGTTGEGVSLTIDERMAVTQRWVEVAGKSLKVIAHVGDLSQRNAATLASHAAKVGAAGVAAMPAFFFKPAGVAGAVDFCKPIAKAAGDLPFYYYHIPSMNGVVLSVLDLLESAKAKIPNFRGVKFTHPDLMEFQRCHAAFSGSLELAWGVDEILLGALAIGATAAVGSTYNYAAPLYRKMMAAQRAGDFDAARRCSATVCEMVALLIKHGVLRTGKATMAMIGVDCGPTRSPIPPMPADEAAIVRAAYERLGVLKPELEATVVARSAAHVAGNGAAVVSANGSTRAATVAS